jgi:hypothetical protein
VEPEQLDDIGVHGRCGGAGPEQDRLLREGCRLDAGFAGQPVVVRERHHERVVEQCLHGECGVVDRSAQEADVEPVFGELAHLLEGPEIHHLERDVGMAAPVFADDVGQDTRDGRLHRADAHLPELTGRHSPGCGERAFRVYQAELGLGEERASRLGQCDRPARAVDQLCTQLAFELPDLLAQRWLGHVQPLGGPAEVTFLGHGDEVAEQP